MLNLSQNLTWKAMIALTISLMAAVLILALTLNMMAAVIVVVFAISAMIFQRSFSWGWLFLLAILLIFPATRVGEGNIYLNDLLLATLSLIGLISIATGRFSLPDNQLSFYFFLLILLGGIFMSAGFILKQELNRDLLEASMTLVFVWISNLTFQYYFQTNKRLVRFFGMIFFVAILHSVFGLAMLLGNWQTSAGLGISNDKNHHLIFSQTDYQVNGFFGIGLQQRLRAVGLAQVLMISIPISLGFLLVDREKKRDKDRTKTISQSRKNYQRRKNIKFNWLKKKKELIFELVKDLDRKQILILISILVQLAALVFTYSYSSLIFLMIGLLALGILDRNKYLIYSSAFCLVMFSVIFPSFNAASNNATSEGFYKWFDGMDLLLKNWFLGNGWRVYSQEMGIIASRINNSYLFIWNNFGLAGLVIFVYMLAEYFYTLYQSYRRSDGTKRIWLMVILSILIAFIFEGMTNNTLIYGPAAVIFWLLYGAVMNLRRKEVQFGLTETRLGTFN